jgi:MOSC domain-containing protein YiiM
MAQISSIVYKPAQLATGRPKAFARTPIEQAALIAGHGIEGDVKGGNPRRHLNLMSFEMLEQLGAEGFDIAPGRMGEQIVIRGLAVDALARGSRLQIGDALIEVVGAREPCERFEYAQDKPHQSVIGRVGVMAKVLSGGLIRVGDTVGLVTTEAVSEG